MSAAVTVLLLNLEPTRHDLEVAISEVLEGRAVSMPETKAVGCYLADLQ
jgi:hypothetical protein